MKQKLKQQNSFKIKINVTKKLINSNKPLIYKDYRKKIYSQNITIEYPLENVSI